MYVYTVTSTEEEEEEEEEQGSQKNIPSLKGRRVILPRSV